MSVLGLGKAVLRPAAATHTLYWLLVLTVTFISFVTCVFILSQTVRTSPNRNWTRNVNVVVVGAAYVLVLFFSAAFIIKRRVSVRLALGRIPKSRIAIARGDVPKVVHNYIEDEFLRSCAIFAASHPKVAFRPGWGRPGTQYDGIRFRSALLDTIPDVDAAARLVIPSMPPLEPDKPLEQHLRYTRTLIAADEDGDAYFRDYTEAVRKARDEAEEVTENEFLRAMEAAKAMKRILLEYHRMAEAAR